MSKKEEYLKFYIDSNGNLDILNKFIKKEKITLNEFNKVVTDYIKEMESTKKINKLYLEYNLKYKNKKNNNNNKDSKRKETEANINIINNYIKENKHNIKEYVTNYNLSYSDFKKFINNYKNYYLTDIEKNTLKEFLKRENDFNKNNLDNVRNVVDRISDDLVNDKPYDILNYYQDLGWDSKLFIYYLNNNKDVFSSFVIDNVRIYLKKYNITQRKYKLNEFIEYIKKNNKDIDSKEIESIINYMNDNKMPYNYTLFMSIKNNIFNK